jgi:alkylhydroperoxidase family enzyme
MTEPQVTGPRIAPGTLRQLGVPVWVLSRLAGRSLGTAPPAIFTTLGRNRGLFWGWLHFAGRLMPGGRLPRRETELVILRVAHLCHSAYESSHHERLGRRAGLTPDEVARVRRGAEDAAWSPRERLLLATADELVRDRDLSDAGWTALRAELDEREALELLLLVGHYTMLATTLNALRLQPDAPR